MKILFLSNFFPPVRPGGYTQWCQEVAESLKARGHKIGVLTSNHQLDKVPNGEVDIFRHLHLDGDLVYYQPKRFFTHWRKASRENLAVLEQIMEEFSPDLVFVWGMWAMSKALPAQVERLMPSQVVYFLSDYWPASVDMHTKYWKSPAHRWFMRFPKHILGAIAFWMLAKEGKPDLKFEHAICVSEAVRDNLVEAGLPLENARVIHGGTDVCRFSSISDRDFSENPVKFLYAGQLVRHKGVHTAIEAAAKLSKEFGFSQFHLDLVGAGHPEYESYLRSLVDQNNLGDHITLCGAVPKDEMPAIFRQSDILVFPSIYEEPFARMTQEAMLSGLVVVGTTTGGTKEILFEGKTGLTFPKEDADKLARQLYRLTEDRDLCRNLSEAGRKTVLKNFTLKGMVDKIENYLQEVVS